MDIIKQILTNQNFIGTIISVIFFIILGYILKKKNIITNDGKKILSFIIMNLAIPAMAFKAFMCDFNETELANDIITLIISFIIYIILLLLGNLIFIKKNSESRKIYAIFMSLGQISLFSIPIIEAIYNTNEALIPISIITIDFRLFLYIYSFCCFSGINIKTDGIKKALKKAFINPIMICMICGLIIWLTQDFFFQVQLNNESYSILRLDVTFPAIYKLFTYITNLTTPLCMLLIGSTLGDAKLSEIFKSKLSWFVALLRTVVAPLIVILCIYLLQLLPFVSFSKYQIVGIVIGFAAPLSAVVNTYAINYNKEAQIASNTCFISTLLCIITFPILFILISIIFQYNL